MRVIERAELGRLIEVLREEGYEPIGPTVRDGAVVLDRIDGIEDLPQGVVEEQAPGRYRLSQGDGGLFGTAHGPDSAKGFLFPGREELACMRREEGRLEVEQAQDDGPPPAFIGLHACDLAAVAVQDRVFGDADAAYARRRERAFFVGVNCRTPGGTCFCASMGTGPRCTSGFDLAITELDGGFVVEVGTERGEEVLARLTARDATPEEEARVERVAEDAAARMGRAIETGDMPDLLYRNRRHPRWEDAAARCLVCGNCTSACPTCFCHDVVDTVDVALTNATRVREWASCFSEEFSHLVEGPVRRSREARYRQWLTHKFAAWIDQFGTSGCVGCGRCITWCPVGIDVTEEIAAIRAADGAGVAG